MTKRRVLIGAFKHETNSFCSSKTDMSDFKVDTFKAADEIIPFFKGVSVELGGMIAGCEEEGLDIIPSIAASAVPGGMVTRETFDTIKDEMLKIVAAVRPLDGILLSLHGAMVVEDSTDGEGEFLGALRKAVGSEIPIICTLDHHANLSKDMLEKATALFAFDSHPHIDQYERGYEAAKTMARQLRGEIIPVMRGKTLPILSPPLQTAEKPMKDFLALAHEWEEDPHVLSVSIMAGFPRADVPECGCSVIAITNGEEELAQSIVDSIGEAIWDRRNEFAVKLMPVEEAVQRAMSGLGPVILADISDDPGAGAPGDAIYILRELIKRGAKNVGLAVMIDPETVKQAVVNGVRSSVKVRLGGKQEPLFPEYIETEGIVKTIADGVFVNKGPMGRGLENDIGRMAVIDLNGIEAIVTERRTIPFDPEMFRRMGIEPKEKQILVIKSSVHFRAAYGPLAREIILVDTPGITAVNFSNVNFKRVQRPMFPLDIF